MNSNATLLDVLAALLAWCQQASVGMYILGGVVGVSCAGASGWGLWQALNDGDRYHGPPMLGLVMGVVLGSLITIFSIIVGWFSLFYTGTS